MLQVGATGINQQTNQIKEEEIWGEMHKNLIKLQGGDHLKFPYR
jgi:hypothetical protein